MVYIKNTLTKESFTTEFNGIGAKVEKKSYKKNNLFEQFQLQSMVLPAIIFIIIFMYLPLWGLIMAFLDYDITSGILGSSWVGLKHFQAFFTDREFASIMTNTVIISFAKIVICFPAPIILAVMLNEIKNIRFKRTFQTISYMPYFLSWVVVSGFIISILSTDNGSLNIFLMNMGLIKAPVNWLSEPKYFLTILITSNIWKETGFGAIIFIAAIAGINPDLYEAASVDGASRLKQIFVITIPCIMPQIITLLILRIASLLSAGFEDILLLTNNGANVILKKASNVIDTYVYYAGINGQRYSYSTAIGMFKSVITIVLLAGVNYLSGKFTDTSLW